MNQSAIECSYITSLNENNIIFYIKEKKIKFYVLPSNDRHQIANGRGIVAFQRVVYFH